MKTYRDLITEIGEGTQDDSELLFEMANLVQRDTGLPFVVWISPKGNARHDVRVKVSRTPKAVPSEMVSVAVRPNVRLVEGKMSASDLKLLRRWVELNRDVLVRYWDGDIESTKDAINLIRPIT
jgi:Domain of unknown function (DUF4160)